MTPFAPGSRIAFIGTRDIATLPEPVIDLYRRAALAAARAGAIIVTGAAPGADQVAATLAISHGGPVELVLPWAPFEHRWVTWAHAHRGVTVIVYDPVEHTAWLDSVWRYHPAGRKLVGGALALHARNYGIVHWDNLVIALPKSAHPNRWGGTGQGIRVACALGIPCFNLLVDRDREVVEAMVRSAPAATAAPAGPER